MDERRNVRDVLAQVQHRVSCPKSKFNKFGGYSYRSLEDINTALKPVCEELGCGYGFEDSIERMESEDGGRWYLRATVTFWAEGCDGTVSATAYAREPVAKKGMDEAQITGLASSYARKYAACGLFAIDSGEDPDQMDNRTHSEGRRQDGGSKSPRRAKTPSQTALQAPSDSDENELMRLASLFGGMCGKSATEVMRAVVQTRTLQDMGAGDGSHLTPEQVGAATSILRDWTRRKSDENERQFHDAAATAGREQ